MAGQKTAGGAASALLEAQSIMASIAGQAFGFDMAAGGAMPQHQVRRRVKTLSSESEVLGEEVTLIAEHLESAIRSLEDGCMPDCARHLSCAAGILRDCQDRVSDFSVLDHSAGCSCCIAATH